MDGITVWFGNLTVQLKRGPYSTHDTAMKVIGKMEHELMRSLYEQVKQATTSNKKKNTADFQLLLIRTCTIRKKSLRAEGKPNCLKLLFVSASVKLLRSVAVCSTTTLLYSYCRCLIGDLDKS